MFFGEKLLWKLAYNKGGVSKNKSELGSDLFDLNNAIKQIHYRWSQVAENKKTRFVLPLASYYDVHRAVTTTPLRIRDRLLHNQAEAYADVLDHTGADFKGFFVWFRNREDLENEQRRDDPSYRDIFLNPVRAAVEDFIGYKNMRVRRNPLRLVLEKVGWN